VFDRWAEGPGCRMAARPFVFLKKPALSPEHSRRIEGACPEPVERVESTLEVCYRHGQHVDGRPLAVVGRWREEPRWIVERAFFSDSSLR